MASASLFHAPVLLRARNFQWYWNSAIDPWSSEDVWMKYTDVENEIIEDAYNEKKVAIQIDGGYVVSFKRQVQYREDDENRQRPIKRVQLDRDRSNVHLREERFTLPVPITLTRSTETSQNNETPEWINNVYVCCHYEEINKNKTLADIVQEAAEGIIKEGTALGKLHEAQWLAQQLLTVKHAGASVWVDDYASRHDAEFPLAIGETCGYLYSKESFWYKLLNRILRDPVTFTREHINTVGPFCYLLRQYLRNNMTTDVQKVYRGLDLTDEQRQLFMKEEIQFISFTSTSKNREKAENFGNTLLIIDMNLRRYFLFLKDTYTQAGTDISHISDFPDEEEFLIWPGHWFQFVKYKYDDKKKKHIIYLKKWRRT